MIGIDAITDPATRAALKSLAKDVFLLKADLANVRKNNQRVIQSGDLTIYFQSAEPSPQPGAKALWIKPPTASRGTIWSWWGENQAGAWIWQWSSETS